ncbi:aminomethyl-transferring glycine dehydrogenase subunit GcvPA [Schlesneria paludicola]|uniref:aminomethyl-transferring glycine dehydrogenase subunit GcvPA n=1 Tax=Schlesneria paludicola TaxID=360056 RepID=UPI0004923ABF|nr:aminomethyl-transferring glycine dehydrogenase subunit GcvPA [Schlesneria paludicola]
MSYLFSTADEQRQMLERIGVGSLQTLLDQIPSELQLKQPLDLPRALTELELQQELTRLAALNAGATTRACFMGGGAYDHFIPSVVDEVTSRGEFYTAYTPYQAEASQGTLQAFFEFQSMIAEVTGLDVANSSLYEGGSGVAEAVLMAMRCTDRSGRVVVLGSINPQATETLKTYLVNKTTELVVVPAPNGFVNPSELASVINDQTACVVVQQPNFFGCLESVEAIGQAAHQAGALLVVSFDPLSLGILKRPGDLGADIAVAEGQSLGIPLQFGGPYLGILACRQQFVRKMPGRLIGQTVDRNGQRCYFLNLQAREQHIRRAGAMSNICTNQGLMALRATVYLALLGPKGLREVAELSCRKAHYAADRLKLIEGCELRFASPFFKEFVLKYKDGANTAIRRAAEAKIDIGPALNRCSDLDWLSAEDREQCLLVAVTESRTKDEIDRLVDALANH